MNAQDVIVVSHGFQAHYELGVVNALAANGVRVTLLGSDMSLREKLRPEVEFRNIRGSQTSGRSRLAKAINLVRYHLRLLMHVARNREKTVLLIGQVEPPWLVGVFEGALLRLMARRVGMVVHNILPHNRHTNGMRAAYWLIYRMPNWLIVHTPAAADGLAEGFGIAPSRICVMEHGANDAVPSCDEARDGIRSDLGFGPNDIVLLFFGMVSQYKGLDLLIDAMQTVADAKLLVAGRFPGDAYGVEMKGRLAALAEQGRARTIDRYLDEDEVGRVFAAADATVLPYRYIDQSGVLLLSLSMGLPLIATNVGSFGRYITKETGILVDRPEAGAIAAGISRFVGSHRQFERARIRATGERYTWRNTVMPLVERLAR